MVAVVAVLALALTGCSDGPPEAEPAPTTAPPASVHLLRCSLVDEGRTPLASGACTFATSNGSESVPVADGVAERAFPHGTHVRVVGTADGRGTREASLVVDAPKSVELVLRRQDPVAAPPTSQEPVSPPSGTEPLQRPWTAPVTVSTDGNEPHLTVGSDGTIYYAPTSSLHRSLDGGVTWRDVSPSSLEALPTLGSDTSVSIAPDGSVWFARYWGYAGGTIGCTSVDRGDSWTCDNLAIPGITDRMWIVGLDAERGYLQTNEGLYHHVWAYTTTGSVKYTPHATATSVLAVRNGNMVYDEVHDAVWQVEWVGDTQRLLRVDGATGVVASRDTGIPNTYALPWLAVHNGTLWTTGEPEGGPPRILVARSTDGAEWTQFPIHSSAESVTFSYVAAGPGGRAAVVYYGSDTPGPSTQNGGTWSLYVAETDEADQEDPTWIETLLVPGIHRGNICIGLNCEQQGSDPEARFSGDLIGAWIDDRGDIHVAYNDDSSGTTKNQYIRQLRQ